MSFYQYIEAQRANIKSLLEFELFGATCPRMHEFYKLSIAALTNDKPSTIFPRFLLICHKSFLAAATLIGQAQPDDAGPITRRAIEAVKIAAAIKANPKFAEKWGAYEKRVERWKTRIAGEIPKGFGLKVPIEHELVKQLMHGYGIISDSYVHFTPEYVYASLSWDKQDTSITLQYFTCEQRHLERAILYLLGAHMLMLRILDECLEGELRSDARRQKLWHEIFVIAEPYAEKFERNVISDASEAVC
jgi:hypothetical protein